MAATDKLDRDAMLDLLYDLQHDLGKYIALPLRFLPREAPDAEVREALRTALEETRRGPSGTRDARSIWEAFLTAAGPLRWTPGMGRLGAAVGAALDCGKRLEDETSPLDRQAVEAILGDVGLAIRSLIEEVERG